MSKSVEELFRDAPPGATHWSDEHKYFFRFVGGESYLWSEFSKNGWTRLSKEYDPYMIPRKQPKPWSGPEDGLPPVGTECEAELYKGGGWIKCKVAYVGSKFYVLTSDELTVGAECVLHLGQGSFRAIRTPEQLAAEEREKAVIDFKQVLDELSQDYCMHLTPHAIDWLAVRLDRAGFKREVK